MIQTILTICATAVLSSVLTLGLAYYLFRKKLKDDLRKQIDQITLEVKERIRLGVIEAGMELLPRYRAEVREGFKEAIDEKIRPDLIEKTAKNMADIGGRLVGTGLKAFFGTKE